MFSISTPMSRFHKERTGNDVTSRHFVTRRRPARSRAVTGSPKAARHRSRASRASVIAEPGLYVATGAPRSAPRRLSAPLFALRLRRVRARLAPRGAHHQPTGARITTRGTLARAMEPTKSRKVVLDPERSVGASRTREFGTTDACAADVRPEPAPILGSRTTVLSRCGPWQSFRASHAERSPNLRRR